MIIAFTGHRPNKIGTGEYGFTLDKGPHEYGPVSLRIFHKIQIVLKQYKPEEVICGMALGVDQIACHAAMYMEIPVIAAVPFQGQEKMWPKHSQDRYNYLLSKCKEVVYVCKPGYERWKMQKRNKWMVDQLVNDKDLLVAVWNYSPGGTANCIKYAQDTIGNRRIYFIDIPE